MSEDRQAPNELVIVRRRGGGHDDGHHGGAWKIAFADFMTALMCFFLVMWLINSTDKKTITQVATYFNPLRLNDHRPSLKGLQEPGSQEAHPDTGQAQEKVKDKAEKKSAKERSTDKRAKKSAASETVAAAAEHGPDAADQELLRDPYGALERIAGSGPATAGSSAGPDAKANIGLPLDSFDPRVRQGQAPIVASAPEGQGPAASAGKPAKDKGEGSSARAGAVSDVGDDKKAEEKVADKGQKGQSGRDELNAGDLRQQIVGALADINPGSKPDVEVVDFKNEVLISLTDEFDFGMFSVGSARPSRDLVVVMDRIAKVLAKSKGGVAIRGHTDGRQYRSADNDNWRLSMARAQMAFYMLVRGGVQEKRIKHLEGHADQMLKVAADPLAARNRRIEILVSKVP